MESLVGRQIISFVVFGAWGSEAVGWEIWKKDGDHVPKQNVSRSRSGIGYVFGFLYIPAILSLTERIVILYQLRRFK